MLETSAPINPETLAASIRNLLLEDPRRYRNFGAYWFFIKRLLKRYYDRVQLPLLGDYEDPSVSARLPVYEDAQAMLADAVDAYRANAVYNLGQNRVTDPSGDEFELFDEDVGT